MSNKYNGYRFEQGLEHHPIIKEICEKARKLEGNTEYFEMGGDGDSGEFIMELLSEVLVRELKNNKKELRWVKVV